MYEYDSELSFVESVDYIGDRGGYLAPDECRTCYTEDSKLIRNCSVHR